MSNNHIYWLGKCDRCAHSKEFTLRYGAYWECVLRKKVMREIGSCDGPYSLEKGQSCKTK